MVSCLLYGLYKYMNGLYIYEGIYVCAFLSKQTDIDKDSDIDKSFIAYTPISNIFLELLKADS